MLRFVLLVTAATSLELGRRDALRCLAASCATPAAVAGAAPIDAAPLNAWESYAVLGDSASFNPSARAVAPRTLVAQLARRRAVFLGEHHDAVADHAPGAARGRSAGAVAPLAVGFEAVQQRFQPALDAYGAGKLSERRLAAATEWEQRWSWPFEAYAPVFSGQGGEGGPARAQPATTGGVERGGAPLPRRGRVDYDSLAGSRDVARGGDGLVNFAEYTLQLRRARAAVDDWVGNEVDAARPELIADAAAAAQARPGSAVLPVADYLVVGGGEGARGANP
ncbi:hypothetical protein JL720_1261 [Aureococcus anophagefferens]|nr:hypothetical protein JL720_1261 [Aureococcus anophagefferens]